MNLLLDTSVLIDVLRSRKGRRELLARLANEGHSLATSTLNATELYAGVRFGEEARTDQLLHSLLCYDMGCTTGVRAGMLINDWGRKGKTISLPDAVIAAIAIERGCTLVTDNRKDFPMPELNLYPLPQ